MSIADGPLHMVKAFARRAERLGYTTRLDTGRDTCEWLELTTPGRRFGMIGITHERIWNYAQSLPRDHYADIAGLHGVDRLLRAVSLWGFAAELMRKANAWSEDRERRGRIGEVASIGLDYVERGILPTADRCNERIATIERGCQ